MIEIMFKGTGSLMTLMVRFTQQEGLSAMYTLRLFRLLPHAQFIAMH